MEGVEGTYFRLSAPGRTSYNGIANLLPSIARMHVLYHFRASLLDMCADLRPEE